MSARTDRLRSELLNLKDTAGLIDARAAVKWAARHKNSQLYEELEWNNDVAGEEYRVYQVRQLIAVDIVDGGGLRSIVSLSVDRANGGGYRPIEEVAARPDLREIMLEDALGELNRLRERYTRLTELAQVWAAADQVKKKAPPASAARKRPDPEGSRPQA
jgi:hypothetical protein